MTKYLKYAVFSAMLPLQSAVSFAHVCLDQDVALSGTSCHAALRIGHICQSNPTTAVQVTIPAGFLGAKPTPTPGCFAPMGAARCRA